MKATGCGCLIVSLKGIAFYGFAMKHYRILMYHLSFYCKLIKWFRIQRLHSNTKTHTGPNENSTKDETAHLGPFHAFPHFPETYKIATCSTVGCLFFLYPLDLTTGIQAKSDCLSESTSLPSFAPFSLPHAHCCLTCSRGWLIICWWSTPRPKSCTFLVGVPT